MRMNSNTVGRPKTLIWENFNEVQRDGKKCAACKKCGYILKGKSDRMRQHLNRCDDMERERNLTKFFERIKCVKCSFQTCITILPSQPTCTFVSVRTAFRFK